MLKPDPQTPLSVLRVAELATEVGFPAGAINIVPGDGPTTGAYLVKHPGVDKVAFTGSTKTGGEIMRLCSDPIKRLTLELGGKSPNLVFADANLDDAIPSSVWSIYYAAGQSCEARSRVLVEASLYDEFVSRFADLREADPRRRPARPGDADGLAHLDRAPRPRARLRRARRRGGRGGRRRRRRPARARARSTSRRCSRRSTNAMEVAQEEIFGPVVTVIPFEDEKDAIRIANDEQVRPLRNRVDGRSRARPSRRRGRSSPAWSASTCRSRRSPGIPFGGYKQSGFGRELSIETLELYLETKGVLVSTSPKPFNPFGL